MSVGTDASGPDTRSPPLPRRCRCRAAWSPERALALLQEEAGTGYDPEVVKALERSVTPAAGSPSWVADVAAPVAPPLPGRPAFRRA